MRRGWPLVIIIMSFAIGANSSINTVFTAGLSGILLGIISALTGIVFYFIYNLFLKKKSALGAALGTTAASSALTPAMVAQADPSAGDVRGCCHRAAGDGEHYHHDHRADTGRLV